MKLIEKKNETLNLISEEGQHRLIGDFNDVEAFRKFIANKDDQIDKLRKEIDFLRERLEIINGRVFNL